MRGFSDIVGQDPAIARLRAAFASGRPHHAYLFEGPTGVGKHTSALALAQAWNCARAPGEGCGECESCRKVDEGIHPDVIDFAVFDDEGKVKGQVQRARDLIPRLGFAPTEGRARVVIIDPAHELNLESANALLKTLEEPPPATQFVLCTPSASALLTTIRSRCQRVPFRPLPDEVVARRLREIQDLDEATAAAAAALAGGSLGRAADLSSGEALAGRRARADRLLQAARDGRAAEILDAAGGLSGERDEATAVLDLLWVSYRDGILRAEGIGGDRLPEERGECAAELARRPSRSLITGLRAIESAREAIERYVSPQLAIENLLLRLAHMDAA